MRLAVTLLCAALLAGCNIEADFSDSLQTETLNPDEYRQEIAAIDQLLFRETPLGDDGAKTLKSIALGLSQRIAERGKTSRAKKFLKIESLELKLFAERAGRLPARGTGKPLQNDWMRIRNNLFDDRAWFVRSAADLDYAAHAAAPAPQPRAFVAVPVPQEVARRNELTGRWQAVSMLANGQPSDDRELIGSTWTFDPPRLVVRDGTGHETSYNCAIEGDYLALTTPAGQDGWMKYALDAQGLRLAFYDGLKGKPQSFEPEPGRSDPMLVVVRLQPVR